MLSMEPKDQRIIKSLPGNVVCADCGAANPEWASASFATLLCLDCAGVHRSLGTHISFVRSVTMDSWTEKQLAIMKLGGNQACRVFFETHGVISTTTTSKTNVVDTVKERYSSPAAQLYKQVLIAKYEGKPEPTELPPPMDTSSKRAKTSYQGFGSSSAPPPQPNRLTKKTIIRSLVIVGVATAAALLFLPSSHAALLPTRQVASFYNTVGPALDLMAVVEDEPRNYAIHHAQGGLQQCSSILEIGCGTGRTAESILASFPHIIREYICIEISSKIADLTKRRLVNDDNGSDVSVVNNNAIVTVVNDNALTTPWRPSVDCILAFYVLDIMSQDEIQTFLKKALKSLMNQNDDDDGRLVLVSITKPTTSVASRIVMGLWEWTVHRFPILLGGCRPVQLTEYMSKDEWNVLECTTKSVFGYTSEIVVAAPNPAAIEYSRTEYGHNPIPSL
jgi:SAM-dependent methyltransferase